jgi:hypothetical protein
MAYEKAAADEMVPPPQRAAFARKADWFRMLARIGAKQKLLATTRKNLRHGVGEDTPDTSPSPMVSAARHLFAWQNVGSFS